MMESFSAYVAALEERDRLKAELAAANSVLQRAEEAALDAFAADGVDRITVRGVTIFPRRDLRVAWEGSRQPEELARRLKALGLGHLLQESVTLQTLTAYYREEAEVAENIGKVLPEDLRGLLKLADRFVVGHNRG